MLSREFFSSSHAARAVQEACGAHQVASVTEGKASYWAQTFFVQTYGGKYFVKQTTNPEKAEMSQAEPGATQLASEHGIPCPLALRVFNAGHFEAQSLPSVVYESVTSSNSVVDGSDIAPEDMSQVVLNQVATMLARINGVPAAASTKGFLRGAYVDYRTQLRTLIERTTFLDTPQKDAIACKLSRSEKVELFFHHYDFYPANILFEILEKCPQLLSIVDWERASFAPLGSDMLGLSSIAAQYNLSSGDAFEAYRREMNISPQKLKYALMTFGMTNALRLHARIESIFARDPHAANDEKVALMTRWLNAYTTFANEYS